MDELKNSLYLFFKKSNKYYKIDQLRKEFKIKGEEQTNFLFDALNELEIEGSLFFDEKKGYRIFNKELALIHGKIQISKAGRGFVKDKNGYSVVIESENLNGALNGDIVIINNIMENNYGKLSGCVKKILKRENNKVIFECIGSGKSATLIPVSINHILNINLSNNDYKKISDGDLIVVEVDNINKDGYFDAKIINTIRKDDPDKILKSIAYKNNIKIDFPNEVLEEVSLIPTEVSENDFIDRVDLTDKEIYTIDCDNTKDMDDAVGVEINENGNLILYISIAHVSHYIKEDSAIFKEALLRGTSVYMDNSCIPMLPHSISNGICSLNPNVNRLTRTSIIEITPKGKVINFKKVNSVIKSRKKMKYSEVNKLLEEKLELEDYKPFKKSLETLNNLSINLEKEKHKNGYIEFASNEVEFMRDKNNNIIDIILRDEGLSQKLIENLMILNNRLSAENFCYMPYIYRIHEKPDSSKIKEIIDILNASGYKINPNNEYATNSAINKMLNEFRGKKEFNVISELFLRGMKKAKYSPDCIGHFALALYYYAHTTSPIRRIADLVLQIYEDKYEYWEKNNIVPSDKKIERIEKLFAEISIQASSTERIADAAEKEADKIRTAEYMQNYIGEEFMATIYQITSSGIFAIINNKIKGKIDKIDIDDELKYDSNKKQLIGKHSNHVFHIGEEIKVTIKEVHPMSDEIKFTTSIQKSKQKALVKN